MLSSALQTHDQLRNRRVNAARADRLVEAVDHLVDAPKPFVLTNGALPRPIVPIFGISKKQHLETTSFGCNASSANKDGGRGAACVEDLESPHE